MSGLIARRRGRGRKPRVAVVFERFGPYHVARLDAACASLDVVGVEMTRMDATYAWASTEGQGQFERRVVCDEPDEAAVRRSAGRIAAVLDEVAPDAVATPGWSHPMALAALRWCLARGVPAILMSDSTAFDAPRRRLVEAAKRRLVALYDGALVGGGPQRDYVVGLGMRPELVLDGYDVVDNAHFAAGATAARREGEAGRRRRRLPAGPYFFASCRFVPKKNVLGLLDAYALLRTRTSGPWPLVIAGDGPMRAEIEAGIDARGLRDATFLPGFLQYDDLPAFYGLAGAFVLASTTEQWGLVVNEAMASGLPVVVSNRCGCARDLVLDSVTGRQFDPDDVEALALEMWRVSSPDFPRMAMGRAAADHVAEWGLARFAHGLVRATEIAVSARRRRNALDRALLRLVASRMR